MSTSGQSTPVPVEKPKTFMPENMKRAFFVLDRKSLLSLFGVYGLILLPLAIALFVNNAKVRKRPF
jgi:hypothetical protein